MKRCGKCRVTKDLTEFYKNKSRKDGVHNSCKLCWKLDYQANLDVNRAKRRAHHKNNRDVLLPKLREYYAKNAPERRAKTKQWKTNNKARLYESIRLRELKVRSVSIYAITPKEIAKLYDSNCFYCGSRSNIQIDHILPISKGGRHSIGNLVAACRPCNASKNDSFLAVWRYLNERGKLWQL